MTTYTNYANSANIDNFPLTVRLLHTEKDVRCMLERIEHWTLTDQRQCYQRLDVEVVWSFAAFSLSIDDNELSASLNFVSKSFEWIKVDRIVFHSFLIVFAINLSIQFESSLQNSLMINSQAIWTYLNRVCVCTWSCDTAGAACFICILSIFVYFFFLSKNRITLSMSFVLLCVSFAC